jgi:hypothetical protein
VLSPSLDALSAENPCPQSIPSTPADLPIAGRRVVLGARRFRERIGQVKADQRARGRYLGSSVPFGSRLGDDGELVPHEAEQEAIREMVAMKAQGLSLRAIAAEMQAEGHQISHVGVQGVLSISWRCVNRDIPLPLGP